MAFGKRIGTAHDTFVDDFNSGYLHDNGSQPTSRSFVETCSGLAIKQAFTADNNPKGNADTEPMMRTLKE